ncbi:adenosylcobinamide-phosphate synthase CbiB [Jannaschia sp. LMIT008]|uniref:adenosylcobinamide-phosphate synthase CbiB n=1 Tax=Jannaschia maritima TaxID=3032585 RepID=UPI0028111569|nr:adenosylcobinamide-phosphate synthase CbiB [Jannaschia sp. LMIT008]
MLLAVALALDALLGEPDWLWRRLPHPVVLMGRAVSALDARWNRGRARRAKGVAAIVLLVAGAGMAAWAAQVALGPVGTVVAAAVLLAQRSLVQHVAAVAATLRAGGVAAGRNAVAMIVGRDTAAMDEPDIARAAIESAAENLSDGVVAPAFWFAVGGLPGIAIYKTVNTADSTIGYLTPRHAAFGWAAARLDDAMNWIPARLTAVLILAAHGHRGMGAVAADAARHRSPNAGWPEAALARVLDVALAGPRSYDGVVRDYAFAHPAGRRSPGPADVDRAIAALWRVWWAVLALSLALGALSLR